MAPEYSHLDFVVLFSLHDRVILGESSEASSMSSTAFFGDTYRLTWPTTLSGPDVFTTEIAHLEGDGMVIPLAAGTASLIGTVPGTSAMAGIELILSTPASATFNVAVPGSTPEGTWPASPVASPSRAAGIPRARR